MRAILKFSSFRHFFLTKTNSKIFKFQKIYKWKQFRFKKNFTFVWKTLSLCKWFINENVFILKNVQSFILKHVFILKMFLFWKHFYFENVFVLKKILLSFRKHFHFFSKNFSFCKKSKSKAFRKQIASDFVVVAHACHPALRDSASTWEGLLCRFFYVDVWLQQAARDRIASTCKVVVSLSLLS